MSDFKESGLEQKPVFESAWLMGLAKCIEDSNGDMGDLSPEQSYERKIANAEETFEETNVEIVRTLQKYCGECSDALVVTCLLGPMNWKNLPEREAYFRQSFGDDVVTLIQDLGQHYEALNHDMPLVRSDDVQKIIKATALVSLDQFAIPSLEKGDVAPIFISMVLEGMKETLEALNLREPSLDQALKTSFQKGNILLKGLENLQDTSKKIPKPKTPGR